ncbi:MAG: hypothetical protein HY755_08135 [Nitrospirae bacterium]|nr:hypothetical protein [Nitrospirota bacterium]
MAERNNKLDEISNQLNENILAVKGTLELIDTSVTEDELQELLHKAIERMDVIQGLSNNMLAVLKNCFDKLGETKK